MLDRNMSWKLKNVFFSISKMYYQSASTILNFRVIKNCFGYFLAVLFLEFWKRKEVTLGYHWDVLEFEAEEVANIRCYFWLTIFSRQMPYNLLN